jgi:hypothetical protein
MTSTTKLRAAIIGLLGLAAAEEQMLLAASPLGEQGSPQRWAALPLVAHNTEFKDQQVRRLDAIRKGNVPPEFAEVDHSSSELYQGYAAQPAERVAQESTRVSGDLIAGLTLVSDADLCDPSRNPWLKGRQLWLQVIVRGFWHPTGHLADFYLAHMQPDRAVALAAHAVSTAIYLGAPDPARGMASYNFACAAARAGQLDEAEAAVGEAIALNPDLRAKVSHDPDLANVRRRGDWNAS